MECNRDEALRAKTIAEDKLEKKDFASARKFALKANTLYPGLEGISQMLTSLDVFISGENKISGETDWYGVLAVNPSCDDETIKKQYRKLALLLHPDKNKTIGADGAFKLLSEAWSLLSDKDKRLAYNQRRGFYGFQQKASMPASAPTAPPPRENGFQQKVSMHTGAPTAPPPREHGFQQKVSMHAGAPSAPSRGQGYHNFASGRTSVLKTKNNNEKVTRTSVLKTKNNNEKVTRTSVPTPSHHRTDTFWTLCCRCMMHYEYVRIYLNRTLLCPHCHKAFLASETVPPLNFSRSSNTAPHQQHQSSSNHVPSKNPFDARRNAAAAEKLGPGQAGPNSIKYANFQQDPVSGAVGVSGKDPSIAAKAANVQQVQQKMKRTHTESNVATGLEGDIKKRRLDNDGNPYGLNSTMAQENGGCGRAGALGSKIDRSSGTYRQPNITRELTGAETRNMLMGKAQKEILKKLNEWKSIFPRSNLNGESKKVKESKRDHNIHGHDQNGKGGLSATKVAEQAEKGRVISASLSVPDADFHDFDKDRTENSFGDNEVWAAYDDDDSMPRFYALINKVISRKPFEVRISWLNSKTNREFGPIDWVGSGFYKTCGEFRIGRYETCTSINAFSQKLIWSKGPRGTVQIFPKKSDVWALYKNWSSDWNKHTPDEVVHRYEMAMVLDDYNEEQGVSVAPLMKVDGFKTVFRQSLDPERVKRIPKEEMFRFSHQVPYHLLTGQEATNAPEGCLELDPAATPLELLQVLAEANEVPMIPNGVDIKEEELPSSTVAGLDEIDDSSQAQAAKMARTTLEAVEVAGDAPSIQAFQLCK